MTSDVQICRVTHSNEVAAWTVADDVFDGDLAPCSRRSCAAPIRAARCWTTGEFLRS